LGKFTDQEIIKVIQSGGTPRNQMAIYLMKHWKGYGHKLSKKYHLTPTQQKDAYTDAIVKLITQVDQGNFKGESQLSSYFFSILNNLCVDVLRKASSHKNKATEPIHEWTAVEEKAFEWIGRKDLLGKIKFVIHRMGDNCKAILIDWGFGGYNMKEIAERQQLSSAESARSMKYKCMKKLKALLGVDKK